ncbi:MAG: hypothetical protein SCH70_11870 [Candidatus Methanoperedens sp.]|nr:hypothetical protein [Candidatus Methanoperedens sp.]
MNSEKLKWKARIIFIASILMVLLIPAIDAKPVIIGFNGTIDQNTQYKIII